MRIVLDTNVLLSGIFFGGRPALVVNACAYGKVEFAVSPDIWAEYERAGRDLARKHTTPFFAQFLNLLASRACIVRPAPLQRQWCSDPDDDMFVACALAADANFIISGDKALLALDGLLPFEIVKPADFLARLGGGT